MEKYLILYHSGTGSTKLIAELFYISLKPYLNIEITSIEGISDFLFLEKYDGFIFGFPTYHASPSKSMQEFMEKIPEFSKKKKSFVFTTCGLYSANSLRIFAKSCRSSNIILVHTASYRCPASDGALIAPKMKVWFKFEKKLKKKMGKDVSIILKEFSKDSILSTVPRFKFYSILNYPNKFAGLKFKRKIKLIPNRCTKCNKCIKNCPHNCFSLDECNYPVHQVSNCENCYRCIHNCPQKALSFNENKVVEKQMNTLFFKKQLLSIKKIPLKLED